MLLTQFRIAIGSDPDTADRHSAETTRIGLWQPAVPDARQLLLPQLVHVSQSRRDLQLGRVALDPIGDHGDADLLSSRRDRVLTRLL